MTSEVFAFRLNPDDPDNPDDARAYAIIDALRQEGKTIREIVVEAVLIASGEIPVGRPAQRIGQVTDELTRLMGQAAGLPDELRSILQTAQRLAERLGTVQSVAPQMDTPQSITQSVQVNTALIAGLQSTFQPGLKKSR